jgi:hypothetical protein
MWDLLVYQVGDNSLSEEMVWALKDMIAFGSSRDFKRKGLRIVNQFDLRGSKPRVYDSFEKGPSGTTDGNLSDLVKEIDEDRVYEITTRIPEFDDIKQAAEPLAKALARESFSDPSLKDLKAEIKKLSTEPDIKKLKKALGEVHKLDSAPKALKKEANAFENVVESVETFCVENSAAPEMVEEFLGRYIKKDKRRKMLVLSGHGSGALGDFLPDMTSKRSLSIPHLRTALEKTTGYEKNGKCKNGKIDILGMDSCLMSMAEVAYELRHVVNYLVGAEGWIQNTGWPYNRVLEVLKHDPAIKAESFATKIVEVYNRYYQDYEVAGISTDLAACRLRDMDDLCTALRALAKSIMQSLVNEPVKEAVLLAHWEAQSYKNDQYTDLFDFCACLRNHLPLKNTSIRNSAESVMTAIRPWRDTKEGVVPKRGKKTVLKSCYTGPEFQYSYGLSVYFPWAASDYIPEYNKLSFAKETGWADFLKVLLETSRRDPRPGKGVPLDIGVGPDPLHRSGDPSPRSGDPSPRSGDPSPRSGDPSPRKKSRQGSMKNPARKFRRHQCVNEGS